MSWTWAPMSVTAVSERFAGAPFPWWICGGWAIDLFLGRETRTHADIEVGVRRCDQPALFALLEDLEVHEASDGVLTELTSEQRARGLPAPHHGFWCRPRGVDDWTLELLLEESDGDDWVFRRDARVRRPFAELTLETAEGVPIVVPEVQLLFKAKALRDKDAADFASALPALSPVQRDWLASALRVAHEGHPWLPALA